AGLRVLFDPDDFAGDALLGRFLRASDGAAVLAALRYDASPTTDDRPFFFYSLRPRDFPRLLGDVRSIERNNLGLAILQVLLVISVTLTLLLVIVPLTLYRRQALRGADRPQKLRLLGY